MRINLSKTLAVMGLALGLAANVGCKKDGGDDDDEEEETTSTVSGGGGTDGGGSTATNPTPLPQVGAINLNTLGSDPSAALALQGAPPSSVTGCQQANMGIFGIALGAACHTAPLAASTLIGNESGDHDGDGDMDCDDLAAAKASGGNPGILLHLMCENVMLEHDNVTSLAGQDDEAGVFAISFADFANDTTAAGSWTQGNAASYPADIRAWNGAGFDSLNGVFALGLTDINNGKLALVMPEASMSGTVQFTNNADVSSCASSPSSANCHWQDVRLYGGEGEVQGPPNGFHLKVYADSKSAPTFIAMEGKFRYTAASAAKSFDISGPCETALKSIRHIYFNAVQKGGQVWGRFRMLDANDDLISCSTFGADFFTKLSDGYCQNAGEATASACTDVDGADYESFWEGETAFEDMTESPVGAIFDGAPTSVGICTTAGCEAF